MTYLTGSDLGYGYNQGTSTVTSWGPIGPAPGEKVRLFAHIATAAGGVASPTITTPSGWTLESTIAGTTVTIATNTAGAAPGWRTQVFTRTFQSGDAAPTISHSQGRFTYLWRSYANWASDDVATTASGADAQTVSAITTTGTNRTLQMVVFNSGGSQAAGSYTATGFTAGQELVDVGFDYNGIAYYEANQAAAGSSGTKVADYSSGGPSQHVIFFASQGSAVDNPPTAAFTVKGVGGTDITVARPGSYFALNASPSTDDNPIPWSSTNPTWSQTSPATPVITLTPGTFGPITVDGTTPTSGIALPTTFTWQLTVKDTINQTGTVSHSLKVSSGPAVSAGADQLVTVSGATTVNLTGTPNPATGTTIASRLWSQISGPAVTLTGSTTDAASFSTSNSSTAYVFRYSATDSDGLTNTDDMTVTTQAAVVSTIQFRPASQTFITGADTASIELLVEIENAAAGEVHYVDEAGLFPGAASRWTRGGLSGVAHVTVTRDEGDGPEDVRYATDLAPTSADQVLEVTDYELPLSTGVTYQGTAFATDASGATYEANSDPVDTSVVGTIWWLSDPLAPEVNIPVSVTGDKHTRSYSTEEISPSGTGQTYVSTIGPLPRSQRKFAWTVVALSVDDMEAYDAILSTGRTLLLRDMVGDKRWVRPTAESWDRKFRYEIWDGSITLVETQAP